MSVKSAHSIGGDVYDLDGGSYPPAGGVGSDIIIQSIAGIYDAGNTQGFTSGGEWFSGTFLSPFDKKIQLVGFLCNSVPDPTSQVKISIHDFSGVKLSETAKFTPSGAGILTELLASEVQLYKGLKYRFCLWGDKNTGFQYKNGLSGVGAVNYGLRSSGSVSDIPANIVSSGIASPIYAWGAMI